MIVLCCGHEYSPHIRTYLSRRHSSRHLRPPFCRACSWSDNDEMVGERGGGVRWGDDMRKKRGGEMRRGRDHFRKKVFHIIFKK